jgi:orotidine-5'-phosphate decarboxylase
MGAFSSCAETLAALTKAGRHMCIGLDTDLRRIPTTVSPGGSPADRVVAFNSSIIEATGEVAAAYKPNIAFYEALGAEGFDALARTIHEVRSLAPGIPVIVDAKRGDIGSTNAGYVTAIFDELGADAVTVHPYLGGEALGPFLERRDALIFVLARTSNPGAREFQDLECGGLPLYRHVARTVARDWNAHNNCGLVVGATYPAELAEIRKDVPTSLPILIPGVGAQGGDLEAVIGAEVEGGSLSFLINVARSVLYASEGRDFAEAAGGEARRLHETIGSLLKQLEMTSSSDVTS